MKKNGSVQLISLTQGIVEDLSNFYRGSFVSIRLCLYLYFLETNPVLRSSIKRILFVLALDPISF